MSKVLVLDTSVLCVWLDVPGMTQCGPTGDAWDRDSVAKKIREEQNSQTTFVLPLACIIETGNHIAKSNHSRYERGKALSEIIRQSANEQSPWAAFSDQSVLWSRKKLLELADSWPELAARCTSIADVTIKDVAEHYAQMGFRVEIFTGDDGLKAYEPCVRAEIPRRRKRR